MENKDIKKDLTKVDKDQKNNQVENEVKNPPKATESQPEMKMPKENETKAKTKDSIIPPADFSTIFNVESEEKSETAQKPIVEAPKVESTKEPLPEENPLPKSSETTEKKNDAFNDQEKVIYEIKPEKEGNPIVVVIFFILLLGTIFALPYVSKKLDFTNNGSVPVTNDDDEEEEETIYYFNKSSVRAKLNGLEFTNFVKSKEDNKFFVTFNITNTNNNPYQFDKKYYVTLLNHEVVVYYALIQSYDVIGTNAAQEITLPISEKAYNESDSFKIEEIITAKYPKAKLNKKEGEYDILTCKYHNDELNYYFIDDKLIKLYENYSESIETSKNYDEDKTKYQSLSNEYKKIENFKSTFIETNSDFRLINEIPYRDVSNLSLSNLKTYKFFRYNENKDVISFEMEAQGYTCS